MLSLDIGRLLGGLVGETEKNIRQALQIADAMAPCILFVDELEKGLSGVHGSGDSGVSTRLFGTLLTWLMGEVQRVLTVADDQGRENYATTLFAQAEAQTGRCTSRSTIYCTQIAAGLMVHQLTRWLRELPIEPDQTLNLLAGELTTPETAAVCG